MLVYKVSYHTYNLMGSLYAFYKLHPLGAGNKSPFFVDVSVAFDRFHIYLYYICNYALASIGIDLRSNHQSTLYIVYKEIYHIYVITL